MAKNRIFYVSQPVSIKETMKEMATCPSVREVTWRLAVVWCFTACSPSSGAFAHRPREHGHAQGIVVAIGLKMDRKDFGSNPHVTLWVGIGF